MSVKKQPNKEYRNKRKKSKENSIFAAQVKKNNFGVFDDKKEKKILESNIGYNRFFATLSAALFRVTLKEKKTVHKYIL